MFQQYDIALGPALRGLFPQGIPSETHLRKLIARINTAHGIGLPSWVFGYNDDGKAMSDRFPCVSFGMNDRSLRITAIGLSACEVMASSAWKIQAALIKELQEPVQMHDRSAAHEIHSVGGAPVRYHLRRLCVGKTKPDSFWWRQTKEMSSNGLPWSDKAKRLLTHMVGNAIYDQAVFLLRDGDTVEGDIGEWLESMGATEDGPGTRSLRDQFKLRLGINITGIGDFTAVRSTGSQGLRVMLKNVELTTRAEIAGSWWIGRGRIEGSGVLTRSRRMPVQLSDDEAAQAGEPQ